MGFYYGPEGYKVGDKPDDSYVEVSERPSEYHLWTDGGWVLDVDAAINAKLDVVMRAYEIDREKLNKAWLSALIADGPNEASRQAILKSQMAALDQQLDDDIEAIFTGE